MTLRFTSLGSGSSGNALVVESGATRVMMDCGFATSETRLRLERVGLAPSDIAAIVVTHEHDDHLGGVARFARRFAIPVYLTRGTAQFQDAMNRIANIQLGGTVEDRVVQALNEANTKAIKAQETRERIARALERVYPVKGEGGRTVEFKTGPDPWAPVDFGPAAQRPW